MQFVHQVVLPSRTVEVVKDARRMLTEEEVVVQSLTPHKDLQQADSAIMQK